MNLRTYLEGITTPTPVEVTYSSEPQMRKKDSNRNPIPWKTVIKVATMKGVVGKTHRQAEQDAVDARGTGHELPLEQARKWGQRVGDTPIIVKGDKAYVEVTELNDIRTEYLCDGVTMAIEDVQPWLPEKREIVSTRTFELGRIIQFVINGKVFDELSR